MAGALPGSGLFAFGAPNMTGTHAANAAVNTHAHIQPLDEDLDPDEDIFLDELEQDWEDNAALADVRAKLPANWHLVKMLRYSPSIFIEVEEWLAGNCRGQWQKHGWSSGCSYSVALSFSDLSDAVLFKLRWCCA